MRYLMMSKTVDNTPDENLYAEMGKFIEEMAAAGVLVTTGGLGPDPIRVISRGSEITVTDGRSPRRRRRSAASRWSRSARRRRSSNSPGASSRSSATARAPIQEVFAP